jgi:hypothetical protein
LITAIIIEDVDDLLIKVDALPEWESSHNAIPTFTDKELDIIIDALTFYKEMNYTDGATSI